MNVEKPGFSPLLDSENFQIIQLLLNAVQDIIIIINDNQDAVFVNSVFETVAQKKQNEIYGKRVGELFECAHLKYPQRCTTTELCKFCNTLKSIQSAFQGTPWKTQSLMIAENISANSWEVKTTPFTWNNKTYVMISFKDVTEETRKQNLERIFYHDILNTVSLIKGFAELINDRGFEMFQKHFPLMNKLVETLVMEIESHRALRDAENERLVVRKTEVDSLQMLLELKESYSLIDDNAYNRIVVSDKAESHIFKTDLSLLHRILRNMSKNALEATLDKQTVTLNCYAEDNSIVFSCHNPTVIPDDIKPFLFHRTITSKGKGRGFGTYSMKLIGEKYLGGKVYFESTKENGTTFYLKLPFE